MERKIIVICGEPSGDLQASLLVNSLKTIDQDIKVFAVGGEFLKNTGAQMIHDIRGLSVLGLFDALKKLGKFKALMSLVLDNIARIKPDAVILVDFSGFNLRLAKNIHSVFGPQNRPAIIYYISPQVWASRRGRVETIKKFIDKIIVIFKFEQEFYERFGVHAEFVGHPLLDIVKPSMAREEAVSAFSLKTDAPVLAILPGSRVSEVKKILPVMLGASRIIKEKIPQMQLIVSKPKNIDIKVYNDILKERIDSVKIIESRPYDCLNVADFCLVASGTATLETAIMQKPNVVVYKMGILTYWLNRPMVKLPYIGMENIVAGKIVAPEFIQCKARPQAIAQAVIDIIFSRRKIEEIKQELALVRDKLLPEGAPLGAARSILKFLEQ